MFKELRFKNVRVAVDARYLCRRDGVGQRLEPALGSPLMSISTPDRGVYVETMVAHDDLGPCGDV